MLPNEDSIFAVKQEFVKVKYFIVVVSAHSNAMTIFFQHKEEENPVSDHLVCQFDFDFMNCMEEKEDEEKSKQ